MQMVINLAPVSLSNKKVNFYTCPRLTFLKKNDTENAYKSISEPLDFKIFMGGGGTPLAAHAFGAWNLPRLVLKSGYGPETANVHFLILETCNLNVTFAVCGKLYINLSVVAPKSPSGLHGQFLFYAVPRHVTTRSGLTAANRERPRN